MGSMTARDDELVAREILAGGESINSTLTASIVIARVPEGVWQLTFNASLIAFHNKNEHDISYV